MTQNEFTQLPAGMYTYQVTLASGYSATREGNAAAVAADSARPGWTVEIVGGSRMTIVND